jgi:hypothetical protein
MDSPPPWYDDDDDEETEPLCPDCGLTITACDCEGGE